jgi:hypothetical protein
MAPDWTFLTNHGRALLCIAHDPGVRLREIAATLGITERSSYGIVADLTAAGYVVKQRDGRRNRYDIQHDLPLREATSRERTIGDVLDLLVAKPVRPRRQRSGALPGGARSARVRRPRAPAQGTQDRTRMS